MNCYNTIFKARARKQFLTTANEAKAIKSLIIKENIIKEKLIALSIKTKSLRGGRKTALNLQICRILEFGNFFFTDPQNFSGQTAYFVFIRAYHPCSRFEIFVQFHHLTCKAWLYLSLTIMYNFSGNFRNNEFAYCILDNIGLNALDEIITFSPIAND